MRKKIKILATVSTWWRGRKRLTGTEKLAWFVILNSVAWVWCSYIFAAKGIANIVETVSRYVVTDVIIVFASLSAKNFGENLSKHNTWPDKPRKTEERDL